MSRHIARIAIPAVILLAGCTSTHGLPEKPTILSPAVTVPSATVTQAPPMRSNVMTIRAKIGDGNPFDWFIGPQVELDTLVVQCPIDRDIRVSFTSDVESRSFDVSGYESVLFDIKVGDDTAATQVKCTFPMREYAGDYSPDRATRGNYAADLAPIFEVYVSETEPGAAMQIWEKGALAYDYAIGRDGPSAEAERSADNAFDIASVSKEFTAVAIMQLIEKGALSFDTPLETFFEGLPNGNDVTVQHLLTHTHGLPDYAKSDDFDTSKPFVKSEVLSTMAAMEADFAPGTKYDYGNTSFLILALIIEDVTKQDHGAYITETILKPLGMEETYFLTAENLDKDRVTGFEQASGKATEYEYGRHISHLRGYGDMVSTFEDLQKWQRGLATGQVISEAMFDRASTRQNLDDGTPIERGIGFFSDVYDGEKVIYNSGDIFTHTRYIYFPEQDKFVGINHSNSIEYHGYVASAIYLHVVGKLLNKSSFLHFGDDEIIDLTDL